MNSLQSIPWDRTIFIEIIHKYTCIVDILKSTSTILKVFINKALDMFIAFISKFVENVLHVLEQS